MSNLPIVLVHGFLGFRVIGAIQYFNRVQQTLTGLGAPEVFSAAVDPTGGIAERAGELKSQIQSAFPATKVHIIAHSMGGLDARYLIGKLGGANLVASLTTLGTPFQGTLAADIAVNPIRIADISLLKLNLDIDEFLVESLFRFPATAVADVKFELNELKTILASAGRGDYSGVGAYFSNLFHPAAVHDLTTANCAAIFPDWSDLKGFPCMSYGGHVEPAAVLTPVLVSPALVLTAAGIPNDGIVPLASAKSPTYVTDIPADHIGLVGWTATDVSPYYRRIYNALTAIG